MIAHINGLQHIGIPSNDIESTKSFFNSLGFDVKLQTMNNNEKVAFLQLKNVMIEIYQNGKANGHPGAIDHVALDVDDIEEALMEVHQLGYSEMENGIQFLPFWENGVRFFTISGPDGEKIEFSQKL